MHLLLKKFIADIFYISLITYLAYFVLELIKTGLVSNYFDLNLLLLWVIAFGILTLLLQRP